MRRAKTHRVTSARIAAGVGQRPTRRSAYQDQTSSKGTRRPRQTPAWPGWVPVAGLPSIHDRTLWAPDPSGRMLWIVDGKVAVAYRVVSGGAETRAEVADRRELPGRPLAIGIGPDGVPAVTVECGDGETDIVLLEPRQVRPVVRGMPRPEQLVLTGRALVMVARAADGPGGELITVDRRTGRELRRLPLDSARVVLRPGSRDEVIVVEGGGRLRYVDTSRRRDECREPPRRPCGCPPLRRPPEQPERPGGRPEKGCACGCCPPCDRVPDAGGEHPPRPDRDPRPDPGPDRDPDGECVPGDDGVPDRCWVTTYLNGKLIRVNICRPGGEPPCATSIPFRPATLTASRNAVFAASQDGRRVAVFDKATLRLVASASAAAGSRVVALPGADALLALSPDGGLRMFDAAPALNLDLAADRAPVATFLGENPVVQFDSSGIQRGLRTVMIVPVLEPGQNYSGDTDAISTYYELENILEQVQAYYAEASYDAPPDNHGLAVRFRWFGADTPLVYTGPPVMLDVPLKTYWGPAWDPGNIAATVAVPGAGLRLSFSGDERLVINCVPAPEETYDPLEFIVRFPAGSYRARIPNGTPSIDFSAALAPSRSISIDGTDRQGNPVTFNIDTSVLTGTRTVDLIRTALEAGGAELDTLADVIEEMLEAGAPGVFERPSVVWQDDGDQTGLLHVSLSFAANPGGQPPELTTFDIDGLLIELGMGSQRGVFNLPGDLSAFETYLRRNVTDAHARHGDFGPLLDESYFDLDDSWRPWARIDGGTLETRISLSTKHGRFPSTIELVDQTGLAQIGFDAPTEGVGADTDFSGGGGPKFEGEREVGGETVHLLDEVFTKMIDATLSQWGDEFGGDRCAEQAFQLRGPGRLPHRVPVRPDPQLRGDAGLHRPLHRRNQRRAGPNQRAGRGAEPVDERSQGRQPRQAGADHFLDTPEDHHEAGAGRTGRSQPRASQRRNPRP